MQPKETNPAAGPPQHTTIRRLKLIVSYAIAGACLAYVLYNVHPRRLLQNILQLKWHFALLAIVADNANYVSQGVRWKLLLQPLASVRVIKAVQATYVALFTSNVLPMRFGEIVRHRSPLMKPVGKLTSVSSSLFTFTPMDETQEIHYQSP